MRRKLVARWLSMLLAAMMVLWTLMPAGLAEGYVWDGEPAIIYRPLYQEENGVVFDDMRDYILEQTDAHLQINFVSVEDYPTTLRLKLAAGEEIDGLDLIYLDQNWKQFYALNQLEPVDGVFQKFAPTLYEKLKTGYEGLWGPDGKLYCMPNSRAFSRGTTNMIRQDWLDKLGMEMPKTLDEYIDFLEAVKQNDMNGNGDTTDEYGIAGSAGMVQMFVGFFLGGTGINDRWMDNNGEIWNARSNPHYIELLDFVKLCMDNGYCPNEWSTMEAAQYWDLMIADRVGTIGTWYSSHCSYMERLWSVNPKAEYVPLLPFTCVEGVTPAYPENPPYECVFCFPKTGNHLEELAKFLEWYTSDIEHMLTVENGIPGVHWEWADKENKIIHMLNDTYVTKSSAYYRTMLMEGFFGPYRYDSYGSLSDELLYGLRFELTNLPDEYYEPPFDFLVAYDYTGTPVESLLGEGKTLFEESEAAFLSGEISREDMIEAQRVYIEIEDSVYSKEQTAQYREVMGIQ